MDGCVAAIITGQEFLDGRYRTDNVRNKLRRLLPTINHAHPVHRSLHMMRLLDSTSGRPPKEGIADLIEEEAPARGGCQGD